MKPSKRAIAAAFTLLRADQYTDGTRSNIALRALALAIAGSNRRPADVASSHFAAQKEPGSSAALEEVESELQNGEDLLAFDHGELDELLRRVS